MGEVQIFVGATTLSPTDIFSARYNAGESTMDSKPYKTIIFQLMDQAALDFLSSRLDGVDLSDPNLHMIVLDSKPPVQACAPRTEKSDDLN